jgi:succinyl-diaminopimelate desuccinylase
MTKEIELLHHLIDMNSTQMVETLQAVLRIPSKKSEPTDNAPFGQEIRSALDYTLDLSRRLGFSVKDSAGYAGHAEFGVGDSYVGALGHLDVVPEGDGWSHPPYDAEIADGFVYARGASDDKGPLFAALFAAKAVMESGLPLKRRIRVIFGCDEESGFGCMDYYWNNAREERPAYAFTPDADFPLIYAEKGISNLILERRLPDITEDELSILSLNGGQRPNMVPDHAQCVLGGSSAVLESVEKKLIALADEKVICRRDGNQLRIIANGKSAHGSTPEMGDNAVARLLGILLKLDMPEYEECLSQAQQFCDISGKALGINGADEISGILTSNIGIAEMSNGSMRLTCNIRYPVTWSFELLLDKCKTSVAKYNWTLAHFTDSPSLYVPLEEEPSQTLLKVYQEETGDTESRPLTTGGGTYARATPHTVAYGAHFPGGHDGPAHEKDEKIAIETLIKSAKIYAHALYQLANLP